MQVMIKSPLALASNISNISTSIYESISINDKIGSNGEETRVNQLSSMSHLALN